jgi:hypothetical protein
MTDKQIIKELQAIIDYVDITKVLSRDDIGVLEAALEKLVGAYNAESSGPDRESDS